MNKKLKAGRHKRINKLEILHIDSNLKQNQVVVVKLSYSYRSTRIIIEVPYRFELMPWLMGEKLGSSEMKAWHRDLARLVLIAGIVLW